MRRRKQRFEMWKSAAGKAAVRGEGKKGRKGCLAAAKKPVHHLQSSFKAGAWHSRQEDGWVHDQAEPSPRAGQALSSRLLCPAFPALCPPPRSLINESH